MDGYNNRFRGTVQPWQTCDSTARPLVIIPARRESVTESGGFGDRSKCPKYNDSPERFACGSTASVTREKAAPTA